MFEFRKFKFSLSDLTWEYLRNVCIFRRITAEIFEKLVQLLEVGGRVVAKNIPTLPNLFLSKISMSSFVNNLIYFIKFLGNMLVERLWLIEVLRLLYFCNQHFQTYNRKLYYFSSHHTFYDKTIQSLKWTFFFLFLI